MIIALNDIKINKQPTRPTLNGIKQTNSLTSNATYHIITFKKFNIKRPYKQPNKVNSQGK